MGLAYSIYGLKNKVKSGYNDTSTETEIQGLIDPYIERKRMVWRQRSNGV